MYSLTHVKYTVGSGFKWCHQTLEMSLSRLYFSGLVTLSDRFRKRWPHTTQELHLHRQQYQRCPFSPGVQKSLRPDQLCKGWIQSLEQSKGSGWGNGFSHLLLHTGSHSATSYGKELDGSTLSKLHGNMLYFHDNGKSRSWTGKSRFHLSLANFFQLHWPRFELLWSNIFCWFFFFFTYFLKIIFACIWTNWTNNIVK